MRVFVTGGSGYVGSGLLERLVQREHEVVALVRDPGRLDVGGVAEVVRGDVLEPETYQHALERCEVCIHLVGILREFPASGITFERVNYQATVTVLKACGRLGCKRFVHMSANGAERAIKTGYTTSKAKAEEAVRASGLDWTILRPSVVYGGREDRPSFVTMLEAPMKSLPLFPYFGDGRYRLAPISLEEVSEAFVNAVERSDAVSKCYHLCGHEEYAYKDLLSLIREVGGFRCRLFPFPRLVMQGASKLLESFTWFPITQGQLRLLTAGNVRPQSCLTQDDLDVPQRSFEAWLRRRAGRPLAPKTTRAIEAGEAPSMTITRNLGQDAE